MKIFEKLRLQYLYILLAFIALLLLVWLIPIKYSFTQVPPTPKREFRAVWIATVQNLDWPSKAGLSPKTQREELVRQLNMHHRNGMNAVIMQVRPTSDAFFPSDFEPWSLFLSGEPGKAPEPYYDPLAFAIAESHKRNMEFHAWFNPFRILVDTSRYELDSLHISRKHPEWCVYYGKGMYFDPGIPEVRNYIIAIIMDVVRRYDVDAIHFDDYFYPYKLKDKDFPDETSFNHYKGEYSNMMKADWRRNNINQLIEILSDSIKTVKPYVKFGISPFGVWRNIQDDPDGSETRAGAPSYDAVYADVRYWLEQGWIDYIIPQVYWHIGRKVADYEVITSWWAKNTYGRHLYIGHAVYKAKAESSRKAWTDKNELPKQIAITRKTPEIQGSAFFRSRIFEKDPLGFTTRLRKEIYHNQALIPTMPWIDSIPPQPPRQIRTKDYQNGTLVSWQPPNMPDNFPDDLPTYYVVYRFRGRETGSIQNTDNIYAIVREPKLFLERQRGWFKRKFTFVVTSVDRLHNESHQGVVFSLKMKH